jgi:hypothetical protein
MSRSIRNVRVAVAALAGTGAIGIALFTAAVAAGGSAPTTEVSAATAVESSLGESTTSGVPAFVDGEDARLAAEELLGAYIESELGYTVADVACSVPATGEVGEQFTCYGLKDGPLVVALRATIGPQRLIELALLLDQTAPTTTTTAPPAQPATTGG